MTLGGFLLLLLIAAICGAIGKSLSGYSIGGCFASIVIGFLGAWVGPIIADELNLPLFYTIQIQGKTFPIVWSIIGSAILSLIIGLMTRGKRD